MSLFAESLPQDACITSNVTTPVPPMNVTSGADNSTMSDDNEEDQEEDDEDDDVRKVLLNKYYFLMTFQFVIEYILFLMKDFNLRSNEIIFIMSRTQQTC